MEKTSKPMVAGILNIVAGVLAFIVFIGLLIGGFVTSNPAVFQGNIPPVNVPAISFGLSILALIISVLALLGGVYALQRKRWDLALTGSIVNIFSSLFLGITFILGIIATIFIAISKNEFE